MPNLRTRPLLVVILCLLAVATAFAQGGVSRPNVLVFLADDWSYPHATHLGDATVRTPNFDRLAREGAVVFERAFVSSPSCTPSRAALLTGRHAVALGAGANLYGPLDTAYANYVTQLARAGYHVGMTRKGWGPGVAAVGGYADNPAGPAYADFAAFRAADASGAPWCFWFGSLDPHRAYDPGSGAAAGLRPDALAVPACWPDVPAVRDDLLDYYAEVERFDRECGAILEALRASGELDRTLVIVTSDNGMPFPRAKANLYDLGTRVPLLIRPPAAPPVAADSPATRPGAPGRERRRASFVSLVDLAPTIFEVAGVPAPPGVQGRSLVPLLAGAPDSAADSAALADPMRSGVFLGRERHANVRHGAQSYPMRAVRIEGFLYVRNYLPERWPAGDPEVINPSIGPYGDVDDSPTKQRMLLDYGSADGARRYNAAFGRRPAEELYDLARDPDQLNNVAADPAYARTLAYLRDELATYQYRYGDPRAQDPATLSFDRFPYTMPRAWTGPLGRDR